MHVDETFMQPGEADPNKVGQVEQEKAAFGHRGVRASGPVPAPRRLALERRNRYRLIAAVTQNLAAVV